MATAHRAITWRTIIVLCLVALALRGAATWYRWDAPIESDELLYDELGWNLVQHHVYGLASPVLTPTALVMPVYPVFLAGCYRWMGHRPNVVRMAQAVIGALTCLPVLAIGAAVGGAPTALVAGWIVALHPLFVSETTSLTMTTVFLALLLSAIAGCARWHQQPADRWSVVAGVCCGLAIACRPEVALWPVVYALWLRAQHRPPAQTRRHLLWLAVLIALTLTPWVARNARTFHRWIPLSTAGGMHVWDGVTGQTFQRDFALDGVRVAGDAEEMELITSEPLEAEAFRASWRVVRQAPGQVVWRMARRVFVLYGTPHGLQFIGHDVAVKRTLADFLTPAGVADRRAQLRALVTSPAMWWRLLLYVVQYALLLLAALGAWRCRRQVAVQLLVLTVVYFTVVYCLMPGVSRYNTTLIALLLPLAAQGLVGLWWREQRIP